MTTAANDRMWNLVSRKRVNLDNSGVPDHDIFSCGEENLLCKNASLHSAPLLLLVRISMNTKGLGPLLRSGCFLVVAILAGCGGGGSGPAPADALGGPAGPGNPAPGLPANSAPSIFGSPATAVAAGSSYAFTPAASDPDFDTLTFSITNRPNWAAFDPATGTLSGNPGDGDIGTTAGIVISVNDGELSASLPTFSLTVTPDGTSGIIAGTTRPEQYEWSVLSDGAQAFVDRNFVFGDIPDHYEGLDFLQTANDDKFVSREDAITFTVTQPATVFVAYDSRISVLPTWLSDWTRTPDHWNGAKVGTDVYAKDFPAGQVTLGGNEMGYSMYNVAVAPQGGAQPPTEPPAAPSPNPPANSPPTISGTAQSNTVVGDQYLFVPSATDPDGDALTFSITDKPSWASFDATNGRLSGRPSAADVGTHSAIVIRVSDGAAVTSLPEFSITVTDTTTGSATLSWDAPTQNADGTPLTDLAGYRVYYGKTLGDYSSSITINNPGVVTAVVDNLSEGTWFFVVTARDLSGNESEESNVASKTIALP